MKAAVSIVCLAAVVLTAAEAEADTEPPIVTHMPVEQAPVGQPIKIKAKISDLSEVFAPSVAVRSLGDKEYVSIEMKAVADAFEATIPGEQASSDLEYFIEAFDEHGNGPGREGTPSKPFRIRIFDPTKAPPPPPPPPPSGPNVQDVVTQPVEPVDDDDDGGGVGWWIWPVVGAAILGGAAAVYFAVRPPGEVDFVDIRVQGPDPTRGL